MEDLSVNESKYTPTREADPTAESVSQDSGVPFDPESSGKSVMLMKRLVEQGATGPVPLLIHAGAVGVFSGVSCSWTGGSMAHH